jgi:hypothetical protein
MLVTWAMRTYKWEKQPSTKDDDTEVIYTLGDAISSFMRREDPHTRGMCLATKDDFIAKRSLKTRSVNRKPLPSKGLEPLSNPITSWRAQSIRGLLLTVRNITDRFVKNPTLLEDLRPWANQPVGWWKTASLGRYSWLIGM